MKKTVYLFLCLTSVLFSLKVQSQTVSFTTSPASGQCYVSGSTYGYAGLTSTTGSQSYSWSVNGPGCTASYTTFSGAPYISIYYPCCGIYTINCAAFTGTAVTTYSTTHQVFCSGSVSVTGTSTLCAGSTGYLHASGGGNYIWQPGNLSGDSVFVTPSSSTCYSVSSTNTFGCNSSAVKCISVVPSAVSITGGNGFICSNSYAILYASGATNYTWLPGGSTSTSIIVTPTTVNCYTLQGYNAQCGVTSSASKCLSVSPSPSISVSGNTAVCGGSTTLTASGATTYTWMTGSVTYTGSTIVVTPSASTCFSITGANSNGCYGYSGVCVSNQGNLALSIGGNSVICAGSNATLTASGAQNYTWNPGGLTGSSIVVSPSVSACYTVVGTNSTGCSGSAIICVNVQTTNSVTIQGPGTICAGSTATLYGSGGNSFTWNPGGLSGSQIVISPSVSTCYTMTTSNACGLISAVKCVSVSNTSDSIYVTGPSVLCAGSTTTLNAFGSNSYTWSPGGANGSGGASIVISPTVPTCYTVVGSGCGGTVSAIKCVSVMPSPTLSIGGSTAVCSGSTGTLTASGASTYTWYGSNGTYTGSSVVFTANATTCFSVIGTTGNGCLAYGGICVSPQNPLSVSGATNICSGNSTTLIASGSASGYTWQPGGLTGSVVVVSPTANVCYTVTSTNTAGCNGYATRCVQVNPKPTISVYPSSTLCIGQNAYLMASGASSYTWLPSNTTGSILSITPSANTCYTVVGTNSLGCSNTAANCFSAFPTASVTISGPNINCGGQSTTLTASGANSYYWLPGGMTGSSIVVSPSASVCYTVTGYPSGQMCPGTAVRCMSVLPAPVISVSGNTSVCSGSGANLSASGAQTYTWIPGNLTGSFITVSPSVSTCYTVVGANSSGCIGVSNVCVTVKPKPTVYTSSGFFCAGQADTIYAYGASSYFWLPYNLSGSSIVISPSVSSCYTVIGTNTAGCSNTTTGCYSVAPSPVINITGNTNICAGSSGILTASGANTYYWLPGGVTSPSIVVSPSVSNCYTVYGSNSFGCTSSAVKCVSVQAGLSISISGNNSICGGSSANLLASGASSYTWNNGVTGAYITVSPSVSTCYTVIGQTATGCSGSAVKCISVQNNPYLSISGNTNICQGSSATLQASGASSYWWSNGSTNSSIVVSPNFNTSYMVVGSNGSCSSSVTINMTVRPKPFVYISISDSILCAGDSVNLFATGAATYTWNNGYNGPFLSVSPTVNTVYSVVGTATNGCSNSAARFVSVSPCTGLMETEHFNTDIRVYPNPSSGAVTITSGSGITLSVSVFDLVGRQLIEKQMTGSSTVDLSGYASGTYILKFEFSGKTSYKKLVIN